MKTTYMASCAVVALTFGCGPAAFAQSAPAPAPAPKRLEDIVVTAQRRSESIQKVPATIQAFTGRTLSQLNVTSFNDLVKYTPNVSFGANGPGSGSIFIRGLSSGVAGNQSSATIDPFPNVALSLDDQSMTFPARNVDVYVADMNRIEVLEGPQGTLFGGGAEAGVVRYITNKPDLEKAGGYEETSGGGTSGGAGNYSENIEYNQPIIKDVLAVRGVIYDDHRGGYIDNVPSTFTRKSTDPGPASYGLTYPSNAPSANNYTIAAKNQNPTTYTGGRFEALWKINEDWNALISQSYQNLDADGIYASEPVGADGQKLGALQETSFTPSHDEDHFENTAVTVNGMVGPLKLVYDGAYLSRHIDQTMDYTNYSRTSGGFYYQCTSVLSSGAQNKCYSPLGSWHDVVNSTHHSEELRLQTPAEYRLRATAGFFYEDLDIEDNMNFNYKTIPSCTAANLAAYNAGGPICLGNIAPAKGSFANDPTARSSNDAFGEDVDRGYTQKAAFGSAEFDIIPKVLTISGGTRYYDYDEYEFGSQYATSSSCIGVLNGTCYGTPLTEADHAAHYRGFRSRGNITYHVTPDAMVYFTYSQGFRPGAGNRLDSAEVKISVDPVTGKPTTGVQTGPVTLEKQYNKPYTYAPDTLDNFEIGFKTDLLDHRLLLNGSAYYMIWNNVQTLIYNPPVYGNTTFGTNGPTYHIKGFELQGRALVTEQFTVDGSLSYNHSREANDPCIKSSNPGNPTPIGSCITEVYNATLRENVALVNALGAAGATPAFSPDLQFNLRGRYEWDMGDYHAFASGGVQYVASSTSQPSSFPAGTIGGPVPSTTFLRYTMPAYVTCDASVGVEKDRWNFSLFAVNLNNSHASTFTSSDQFIVQEIPLRPRVFGAKLGVKF
jgi:iron complex outermembrane receptor protein